MFAVSNYEDIERIEQGKQTAHIIAVLFIRPTTPNATEIIRDFEYLHYRSQDVFSIYAAGYSNDFDCAYRDKYIKVANWSASEWYYSAQDFTDFRQQIVTRAKSWQYGGDIELLVF